MKCNLTISMLVSATAAFAGQRMTVAVCNVDELPAPVIEHAVDAIGAKDARMGPDFIIRVRVGRHITKAGPWLRWMLGQAFMDPGGAGVMADVYCGTIEERVHLYPVAGGDRVLGYSMAHEPGQTRRYSAEAAVA
jgi:hypothetical protein